MLTIKQTLFLVFGLTSFIVFYVGFLNYITIENTFSNSSTLDENEQFKIHAQWILLFSTIVAIGVIAGTLFISKKITEPIEKLENMINQFSKTTTVSTKNSVKTSFKELHNLYENFQRMAKSVETTLQLEKKLNAELQEIDREKNEFTAMISHELKTPLFPIKGYAQILKKENLSGTLNPIQEKSIDEIYDAVIHLDRLIADILTAQKLEMGKISFDKASITTSELIENQIKTIKPILEQKNIQIKNTTNYYDVVFTDKDRINQVFTNLISNAIDFVPKEDAEIEIGSIDNDEQVTFFVKDNGNGIPKSKLNNLFRKFYQVDSSLNRKHDGSGLGLAICKGIIESLGGKIWVESKINDGTCFYFTIPKKPLAVDVKN